MGFVRVPLTTTSTVKKRELIIPNNIEFDKCENGKRGDCTGTGMILDRNGINTTHLCTIYRKVICAQSVIYGRQFKGKIGLTPSRKGVVGGSRFRLWPPNCRMMIERFLKIFAKLPLNNLTKIRMVC
eukprot:Selendium_serpulae@DN6401_c1_g2_i4.p1